MATLLLMRHAQAERGGGSDYDRSLTVQGRGDALEAGRHLASSDLLPDVVLVSGALRARQTWDRVKAGLGVNLEARVLDQLYGSGPREVFELLRTMGAVGVVLVIGHEPTISATGYALARSEQSDQAALLQLRGGMSTASVAVLRVDSEWAHLEPHAAGLAQVLAFRA